MLTIPENMLRLSALVEYTREALMTSYGA